MKVKAFECKCPKCGATLEIEKNRSEFFCSYCGSKILLDERKTEHIYRKIDEARIEEAHTKKELGSKEIDYKLKLTEISNKNSTASSIVKIIAILAIVVVLFFILKLIAADKSVRYFFIFLVMVVGFVLLIKYVSQA